MVHVTPKTAKELLQTTAKRETAKFGPTTGKAAKGAWSGTPDRVSRQALSGGCSLPDAIHFAELPGKNAPSF
jgi:hypothetical protein